jgi:hypothetical protein
MRVLLALTALAGVVVACSETRAPAPGERDEARSTVPDQHQTDVDAEEQALRSLRAGPLRRDRVEKRRLGGEHLR